MKATFLERLNKNIDNFRKTVGIKEDKKITAFLIAILTYSIICRILPQDILTIVFILTILGIVFFYFYLYVFSHAITENKNQNTVEYSWGYIKEQGMTFNLQKFFHYLKGKDFGFYKNFITTNKQKIILISFIFIDIIVALKNLSLFYSGAFIAMSLLTKFVFIGYLYIYRIFKRIPNTNHEDEEKVLDIFYSQLNGLVSVFFVLFIFFFILSKFIVDIFYGDNYISVQSSLPFILLANMFICVALVIYETARKIDPKTTSNIFKVYLSFFSLVFIFLPINYIDTITYFIIGSACLISIFLYNFVIKKPVYIENTYNHLF